MAAVSLFHGPPEAFVLSAAALSALTADPDTLVFSSKTTLHGRSKCSQSCRHTHTHKHVHCARANSTHDNHVYNIRRPLVNAHRNTQAPSPRGPGIDQREECDRYRADKTGRETNKKKGGGSFTSVIKLMCVAITQDKAETILAWTHLTTFHTTLWQDIYTATLLPHVLSSSGAESEGFLTQNHISSQETHQNIKLIFLTQPSCYSCKLG